MADRRETRVGRGREESGVGVGGYRLARDASECEVLLWGSGFCVNKSIPSENRKEIGGSEALRLA